MLLSVTFPCCTFSPNATVVSSVVVSANDTCTLTTYLLDPHNQWVEVLNKSLAPGQQTTLILPVGHYRLVCSGQNSTEREYIFAPYPSINNEIEPMHFPEFFGFLALAVSFPLAFYLFVRRHVGYALIFAVVLLLLFQIFPISNAWQTVVVTIFILAGILAALRFLGGTG